MNIRSLAAWVFTCAVFLGPVQAKEPVSIENGMETVSTSLNLPSSLPGALVVSKCSNCKTVSVQLTDQSQLLVGREKVTLADLRQFFADGEPYFVMVFVDARHPVVKRLIVNAQLSKLRQKAN